MNEFMYSLGLILGIFDAIAGMLLMPALLLLTLTVIAGGIKWIVKRH